MVIKNSFKLSGVLTNFKKIKVSEAYIIQRGKTQRFLLTKPNFFQYSNMVMKLQLS